MTDTATSILTSSFDTPTESYLQPTSSSSYSPYDRSPPSFSPPTTTKSSSMTTIHKIFIALICICFLTSVAALVVGGIAFTHEPTCSNVPSTLDNIISGRNIIFKTPGTDDTFKTLPSSSASVVPVATTNLTTNIITPSVTPQDQYASRTTMETTNDQIITTAGEVIQVGVFNYGGLFAINTNKPVAWLHVAGNGERPNARFENKIGGPDVYFDIVVDEEGTPDLIPTSGIISFDGRKVKTGNFSYVGNMDQNVDSEADVQFKSVAIVDENNTGLLHIDSTSNTLAIDSSNHKLQIEGTLIDFTSWPYVAGLNQMLSTTSSPIFQQLNLLNVFPAQFTITNTGDLNIILGGSNILLVNGFPIGGSGVDSITGTANQIIASSPTGTVTLSLPQDIATVSTPTFGGLTLTAFSGIPKFTVGVIGTGFTTTDDLPVGASNLYFTDSLARAALSGGTGIDYNPTTGVIATSGLPGGVTSITGTTDQITASSPTGDVTLSLPQDIATTSTPTFGGLTLATFSGIPLFTGGVIGTGSTTTDNLPVGSLNLYFTDSLARAALSGGTGIDYNPTTGVIATSGPSGGVTSITGTPDQVIASASTGDVTLSLPQSIANSSTPTFTGLIAGTAALLTSATDGFLNLPSCNGTPVGTPTPHTGTNSLVYDSSTNSLNIYNGGAWHAVGQTQSFEWFNTNLSAYPFSVTYNGSNQMATLTYTVPGGTVVKTYNYTGNLLTSIVLSGTLPSSLSTLTKTLSYNGSNQLTGVAYS